MGKRENLEAGFLAEGNPAVKAFRLKDCTSSLLPEGKDQAVHGMLALGSWFPANVTARKWGHFDFGLWHPPTESIVP